MKPPRTSDMPGIPSQPTILTPQQRELVAKRLRPRNGGAGAEDEIRRRNQRERAPLSFAQQGLWFLQRLNPSNPFYTETWAFRRRAAVDARLLEHSIEEVMKRHEILRTCFPIEAGRPIQTIRPRVDIELSRIDLSALPAMDRQPEVERICAEEQTRPFDLSQAPLLRTALIRLGDEDYVFLLSMHHLICDSVSARLFLRDLEQAYLCCAQGLPAELGELPIQYADYAAWERGRDDASTEPLLREWKLDLAEAPVTGFPLDRPRPRMQSHRGASESSRFSPSLTAALSALAEKEGVTLFTVLLAGFYALLFRYTGQSDLVVGSPVNTRAWGQTQGLIGLFVNTLPLRVKVDGDCELGDLLQRARDTVASALGRSATSFDRLVEALNPQRDPSRNPLFQTVFAYEPPGAAGERIESDWQPLEIARAAAKFDFTLVAEHQGEDLRVTAEYSTDLFDAGTARRLLDGYQRLLEGMAAGVGRVWDLPLLNEAELRRTLVDWNAGEPGEAPDGLIHERFGDRAAAAPDAVAVVFGEDLITYAEIDRRSDRLARRLRPLGVGAEIPVGVCLRRGPDMLVALLGVLKAGGAYLPIDPAFPEARRAFLLEDSRAPALIAQAGVGETAAFRGRTILIDRAEDEDAPGDSPCPAASVFSGNLACLLYTSGSTGVPKGVSITHRGLLRMALDRRHVEIGAGDCVFQLSPFAFDASTFEIWGALLHGARLVVVGREIALSPPGLGQELRRQGASVVFLTTALFHELVRQAPEILTAVPNVLVGGEAADPTAFRTALARGRPGRLVHMYGPAEAVTFASWNLVQKVDADALTVPIGRPVSRLRLYLLDRAWNPVPVGAAGELYVGGDGFARGYFLRPGRTAESFLPDPFRSAAGSRMYRTGDRARFLPDGRIEFLGRFDDQVKLRGFRVEPGEVEAALRGHPAVGEAVVAVQQDQEGRKRLVGYVTASHENAPDSAELRRWLQRTIPEYMVPAGIVVMERLPWTASGKVDRRALPQPDLASDAASAGFVAPSTDIEKQLAAIWRQVLKLTRVGVHDNFFAVGGDSILSIQIAALASQAGIGLSPQDLFERQTIAELATAAREAFPEGERAMTGPVPLTPIQRWFFERNLTEPHHFNQAVCLDLLKPITGDCAERALDEIARRHDALRLRFRQGVNGWGQTQVECEDAWPLERIDLAGLDPASQEAAFLRHATRVQGGLELTAGPLARAALFDLGGDQPARLLLVIHHLVVDVVSWRILLEDLNALCLQAAREEELRPLRRTTAFSSWARRLEPMARSEEISSEIGYWRELSHSGTKIPFDLEAGPSLESEARAVSIALDAAETERLLRELPAAAGAQVNEILLGVVALALAEWTGERRLLLDVEGHGREALFEDVDLSRTVGWFTTLFPVEFELPEECDAGSAVQAVKRQWGRVPRRGMGFGLLRYLGGEAEFEAVLESQPQAEISFNYLGRWDDELSGEAAFRLVERPTGPDCSPRQTRHHAIEIDGAVRDGRLRLDWRYSPRELHAETIERVARKALGALRELLGSAPYLRQRSLSAEDIPLVELNGGAIQRLQDLDGDIENVYPLSPLQKGMLFDSVSATGPGVYFEQFRYVLRGTVDTDAMRRAWDLVARRHPILRSSFVWEGLEEPLQVVRPPAPINWREEDWRGLDKEERGTRLAEFLRCDRERGFELTSEPPMRLTLFSLADDQHDLVWSFHHALLDGWSMSIVLREVFVAYEAFRKGRQPLLEAARPYREYIAWLGRQDRAPAEAFWRGQLRGFAKPTPLPLANPKRGDGPAHFGEASVLVSPDASAALESLGRQRQLTLNSILQGAWALLLSRHSGEADVGFGSTVAGRPASLGGVDSMVGVFLNTVVTRIEVASSRPVVEWLREVQEQLARMRRYEHNSLVELQTWSEIPRGTPLFESIFVFENYPVDPVLRGAGESIRIEEVVPYEQTTYPLSVFAAPGAGLRLSAVYDRRRYSDPAAEALLAQLAAIVEQIAAFPDCRVDEISLLTDDERRRLLRVSVGAAATEAPATVVRLFQEQVERSPDAIAVNSGSERWSYRELNQRSNQLARHLRSLGVGPEMRVGLCAQRSPLLLVGLLGILKAGGAYVPLDAEYPLERLSFLLEDAQISALVTEDRLLDSLPTHWALIVSLDSERDSLEGSGVENLDLGAGSENLAYVIYTSGSTGRPKGVMLQHGGLANLVEQQAVAFRCGTDSRVLQFASLSFDASVSEIFVTLTRGATLVLATREEMAPGDALSELLRRESINLVTLPPSILATLSPDELPELTTVVSAGEACHGELAERWGERVRFLNAYGPTETTVCATVAESPLTGGRVSIGLPLAGTQAYVLDARLRLQAVGVAGEIYIGGAGVARGYLNQADRTAESFVPNPFSRIPGARLYRSGDLGRYLPDGSIEFLRRRDHQIKLRGFRIEPGEVEAALRAQPGVREAAVVVRNDPGPGPRLVAYITTRAARPDPLAGQQTCRLPNGLTIAHLNQGETDLMYREIFREQSYTRNGISLEEGDCVFDVGANIGLFTLFAGRLSGVRVFAFEPMPRAVAALRANVERHGVDARVFDCGLSRREGEADFAFYPLMSGMSGLYADAREDESTARAYLRNQSGVSDTQADDLLLGRFESKKVRRPLKTLSQVIRSEAVERIDLLKIDVEKSEADVLAGIEEEHWERIRQIVMELHDAGGRLDAISAMLSARGFIVVADQDPQFESTELKRLYAFNGSLIRPPGEPLDEGLVAAREGQGEGPDVSIDKLRTALSAKLPSFMVPSEIVLLETLPLTPNGKLDLCSLPAPAAAVSSNRLSTERPRSSVEEILCGIWGDVLRCEQVGVDDSFFELGGHSLVAATVVSRVREAFEIDLPLPKLLENPTVAELARAVEAARRDGDGTSPPAITPAPRERPLELSFAQESLWFLNELEGGSAHYNCPCALRWNGPLNQEALEFSLREILRRHEVLRTRFPLRDGKPAQVVEPADGFELEREEIAGLAEPERSRRVELEIARDLDEPFDLRARPPFRARLIRLADHDHALLLTMHHIVCDGWSLGILMRELTELYRSFCAGSEPALEELAIQYADYAARQRTWMREERLEKGLAFWRGRLQGAQPAIRLPDERHKRGLDQRAGACLTLPVPNELREQVEALSRRMGATVFMTLLAAFQALLSRLSGSSDIVVGVAAANRDRAEVSGLIGLFLSMLAVRSDLSANPRFEELLKRTRADFLDALAHRDAPYEGLIQQSSSGRNAGSRALFEIAFGLDRPPQASFDAGAVTMECIVPEVATARYDLTVWMSDSEAGLDAHWTYRRSRFDAAGIERLHHDYLRLLASAVADPRRPIEDLELRSAQEIETLMAERKGREATKRQKLLGLRAGMTSAEPRREDDRDGE